MKPFQKLFFVFSLVAFLPLLALAEAADVIPKEQWVLELVTWLFSIKGASVMAIAVGVSQLLMKFFKTTFGDFAGKWKLLLVAGFSLLAVVLGGMLTGLSLPAAAATSQAIAAFQVFFHQILAQFQKQEVVNPIGPIR